MKNTGDIVSFGSGNDTPSVTSKPGNGGMAMRISTNNGQNVEIMSWGKNNLLPQDREALVLDSNIVGELIGTKRDITLGSGLIAYKERFEDGTRIVDEVEWPAEAKAYFDNMKDSPGEQSLEEYLRATARDVMMHANTWTEFIRDGNGQIMYHRSLKARHMRPQKHNAEGKIENWFWSGNWKEKNKPEFIPKVIPNYRGGTKQNKFVLHAYDDILSDDYLGIPTWWGGRAWVECANAIPIFHINNLRNGYTIRYHIEIPKDYFTDNTATDQTRTKKDNRAELEKEARLKFLSKLNAFLAGYENAGRAIVTEYEINRAAGKEFPGIKITPLNVDLKDKALLELFASSNDANISAQGLHPVLAGIQTQGKLSSGSDIRNAFLMYVAIKAPVKRNVILQPINLLHRLNNWDPSVKWGFRDIEITKLDENPTGSQSGTPTV